MKNYIITEGSFDKKFLEKVLPPYILTNTRLIESMSDSSAVSLARSIFLNGNSKVLLALDANTTDENEIKQKESYVRNNFNLISSDSEYKVSYFIPEIESLLFVDKNFIERLFMIQMNEFEFELSKSNPKSSLKKLSKNEDYRKIIDNCLNDLPEDIIRKIQKTQVIDEMIKYVSNIM